MESWDSISHRLSQLHCPLLENLDDSKIAADLSNLRGDLRYNLLEWLFLTYDAEFYSKFEGADQTEGARLSRLTTLSSMCGLCQPTDQFLVRGEGSREAQVDFFVTLIELTQASKAGTSWLDQDLALIERAATNSKKLFNPTVALFTHPSFKTAPPDGQPSVTALKGAEKELHSRCEALRVKVQALRLYTLQTDTIYPNLSGEEFFNYVKQFVDLYDQSLEVWTKQVAPKVVDLEPTLRQIVASLSVVAKTLDSAEGLARSYSELAKMDAGRLDWTGLDEQSLDQAKSHVTILEKSLMRRGIKV